jgi:hypothetical protein
VTSLPEPVSRYLKRAIADQRTRISRASLSQRGQLRSSPRGRWLPFRATQRATTLSPGFVWLAQVSLAPFVRISIRDAYEQGRGSGEIKLFSTISIAAAHGQPELNAAALHRYLAEAVWYPTALRPHAGLSWTAIDDRRALATLTDAGVTVALEFRFGTNDEVVGVYTSIRYRQVGRRFEPTAWEGHFSGYEDRSGAWIPTRGEVGWYLEGEWQPVWRGQVTAADYEHEPLRSA